VKFFDKKLRRRRKEEKEKYLRYCQQPRAAHALLGAIYFKFATNKGNILIYGSAKR
jgi:hypothetical protein